MKKNVLVLCVSILCFVTFTTYAQVKFGVKVGVNSTSVGVDIDDKEDEDQFKDGLKSKFGYSFGLATEIGFTNALSLQTGLNLINKGFKLEATSSGVSYKINSSITYLEVPLNVAYKINNFQIHAGPYVAFGIFGKDKYENKYQGISNSGESKIRFKNKVSESDWDNLGDDEDFMSLTDVGLNIGGGYRFGPVLVSLTYSKGFSNIESKYEGEDDNFKLTNKVINLAATWFF